MRRWRIVVALFLGAVGCGGGTGKMVKVQGVVTLDGEPLTGAAVTFTPTDGVGPAATGRTGGDGKFRLMTFAPNDGAVPGDYKVTITKIVASEAAEDPGSDPAKMKDLMMKNMFKPKRGKKVGPSPVPKEYGSVTKTPLRCRVPPGEEIKFDLHKAGGS